LLYGLVYISDNQMSMNRAAEIVLCTLVRRPSSRRTDPVHLRCIKRVILISHILSLFAKKCMHVHPHLKVFFRVPIIFPGLLINFEKWLKVFDGATDNRKHDGKSEFTCSDYRGGRSSNGNPDRQRAVYWPWEYFLVNQWFPKSSRPRNSILLV